MVGKRARMASRRSLGQIDVLHPMSLTAARRAYTCMTRAQMHGPTSPWRSWCRRCRWRLQSRQAPGRSRGDTAICAGFWCPCSAGRDQFGAPAGGFLDLVAGLVMQIGVGGLIPATFLAGLMLLLVGLPRPGGYLMLISSPVGSGPHLAHNLWSGCCASLNGRAAAWHSSAPRQG